MNCSYVKITDNKCWTGLVFTILLFTAEIHAASFEISSKASNDWQRVLEVVHGAIGSRDQSAKLEQYEFDSLGTLPEYGQVTTASKHIYESIPEASRRILASGVTTRTTPEETSVLLKALAVKLELAAEKAGAQAGLELKFQAMIANFHSTRIVAAIRYNLFKRGLNLGELYAATLKEREAVSIWRQMTSKAGEHKFAEKWKTELKKLENNLAELEGHCCPPTPAILQARIWNPSLR